MILGIETSCDDTSAAVYDGQRLLSNVISTHLVHRNFGGVVPELASRAHIPLVMPVIRQALDQAAISRRDLDAIAVTYGPGLAGSLLVGLSVAKGMSLGLDIPLVGVNHLEGHIWANALAHPDLQTPFVVLVVSGGHTSLFLVKNRFDRQVLAKTRDDAVGEVMDKVSKFFNLGYPGGPILDQLSQKEKPGKFKFTSPKMSDGSLDFSFSIKTASR